MDPNECLKSIMGLLEFQSDSQDDRDEVAEKLENLAEWIRKGGFYPKVERDRARGGHRVP